MGKKIKIPNLREIIQDLQFSQHTDCHIVDTFVFKVASALTQRLAKKNLRSLGYDHEQVREVKIAFLEIINEMCK